MSGRTLALDTSAIFAILLGEQTAAACEDALADADRLLLSAATLTEMLVVAIGKNRAEALDRFLDVLKPEIVPLTPARAKAAAEGYRRWGKGIAPASLNICDSFAYALAMEHECRLLFVGNDFSQTDVAKL